MYCTWLYPWKLLTYGLVFDWRDMKTKVFMRLLGSFLRERRLGFEAYSPFCESSTLPWCAMRKNVYHWSQRWLKLMRRVEFISIGAPANSQWPYSTTVAAVGWWRKTAKHGRRGSGEGCEGRLSIVGASAAAGMCGFEGCVNCCGQDSCALVLLTVSGQGINTHFTISPARWRMNARGHRTVLSCLPCWS